MRTIFVTGSDTGVGKTHVVATLARLLAATGARVQIVKVVETGRAADQSDDGDAARARRSCGADVAAVTLATFSAPLSPPVAAALEGKTIHFADLAARARALPPCDWRILEGAGGIATPVDDEGRDWADFAAAIAADATIVVVPNRLGAINQARLAHARATQANLRAGVWLNATASVDAAVAAANHTSLRTLGVPLWGEQAHGALEPLAPEATLAQIAQAGKSTLEERTAPPGDATASSPRADALTARCRDALAERTRSGLRRGLRVTEAADGVLNLADNDYLALARDSVVASAVASAAIEHGTSASASPLITGWRASHAHLVERLCAWHGLPCGLLWSSGYAANTAVLGELPARGDLVLADRLIHHSMIAGLLRSGARLQRYEHLRLDRLEELLAAKTAAARTVFVVTESVFSMDGDYPDLARMAELKRRYGFCWIVDEAHGLGWYGREGAGLAHAAGVQGDVDVLVGTLGKTLASGGAYTLFRDETLRDYLVNHAGEFIYSTALSPINVAAATAALERVRLLAREQPAWHAASREFRARLRRDGWRAPDGDSPIVPVLLDTAGAAVALAESLRQTGVWASAVRPPTVPAGTSRLRLSLKRTFGSAEAERVLTAMNAWRAAR